MGVAVSGAHRPIERLQTIIPTCTSRAIFDILIDRLVQDYAVDLSIFSYCLGFEEKLFLEKPLNNGIGQHRDFLHRIVAAARNRV